MYFQQLIKNQIFSKNPYQKAYSKELIEAVKTGNIPFIKELLNFNKYLVYDFDNVCLKKMKLKPLHWSVKRDNYSISQLLITNNADVNAKDILGRSPLYFAYHLKDIKHMIVELKSC